MEERAADLIDVMIAHSLAGTDEHAVLDDPCRRLAAVGVPLLRGVANPQELPTLELQS